MKMICNKGKTIKTQGLRAFAFGVTKSTELQYFSMNDFFPSQEGFFIL